MCSVLIEPKSTSATCHCWAFDPPGYRELIEQGGFRVLRQEFVGMFQVVLGWRPCEATGNQWSNNVWDSGEPVVP